MTQVSAGEDMLGLALYSQAPGGYGIHTSRRLPEMPSPFAGEGGAHSRRLWEGEGDMSRIDPSPRTATIGGLSPCAPLPQGERGAGGSGPDRVVTEVTGEMGNRSDADSFSVAPPPP